jgi:hypothetical protein
MTGLSPVGNAHLKVRLSKKFISLGLNNLIFSSSADFGTCDTSGGKAREIRGSVVACLTHPLAWG